MHVNCKGPSSFHYNGSLSRCFLRDAMSASGFGDAFEARSSWLRRLLVIPFECTPLLLLVCVSANALDVHQEDEVSEAWRFQTTRCIQARSLSVIRSHIYVLHAMRSTHPVEAHGCFWIIWATATGCSSISRSLASLSAVPTLTAAP